MKQALVTGHRGFVGRHMAAALREAGWEVTGADVRSGVDCRLWFESPRRFDLIVHCAANVGGRAQISGDPLAVAENLELDAAMFRFAVRSQASSVIYFSSSAAYPTILQDLGLRHHLREQDVDFGLLGRPDSTYGWAKVTGEVLAEYARAEGVAVHILRPFSGYGADQALDYPFPAFVERALRREDPFTVWGSEETTRDWVHISDIVACAMAMLTEEHYGPLNVGTGVPTTFGDLARMVMRAAGYEAPIEVLGSKPTGPSYRVADTRRLHQLYVPRVTLIDGLLAALNPGR